MRKMWWVSVLNLGRKSMKTLRTHGAILWVAGVRKLTLSTPIVTTTEKVTRIMVKSRYWLVSKLLIGCWDVWTNLAKERHGEGGGGDDLGKEEEEHGEGEQDGDGERHLQKIETLLKSKFEINYKTTRRASCTRNCNYLLQWAAIFCSSPKINFWGKFCGNWNFCSKVESWKVEEKIWNHERRKFSSHFSHFTHIPFYRKWTVGNRKMVQVVLML